MHRRRFLAAVAATVVAACAPGSSGGALRRLASATRLPFPYGDHPQQVADLWLPTRPDPDRRPVVVLVHGGYWRPGFDRHLMQDLAVDVVERGWAAWNVDYRPSGPGGGGWPGTFADVATGIDGLADAATRHRIDPDRVVVVGHSAGGCLALWAAARPGLPEDAPGAAPRVQMLAAASQGGVNDLRSAVAADLGQGAVTALMGAGPDEDPERYALASPAERLPLNLPQVLVHGTKDIVVPRWQSSDYANKAVQTGDDATLLTIEGADHFELIDPAHRAWRALVERLAPFLDS